MSDMLSQIGVFTSDIGAEIVSYDADRQVVYVVSGQNELEVLDISDPTNPSQLLVIDLEAQAGVPLGGANSVAYQNGILAIAVGAETVTDPGVVVLVDLDVFATNPGSAVNVVTVGALPDNLVFTPDGNTILVANEGEPNDDYTIDPEGSISLIDVSGGIAAATVATADFTAFNADTDALVASGVRVFGPGATLAQDLEPEFITVSADSTTAYVALQENNTLAVVDIATATVTDLLPLGTKDYSDPANAIDASNEDGGITITTWPVVGLYQPDSIATYTVGGETYIITANEGDARDYDGFSEEARVADVVLDPVAFPNADVLQLEENLGRLKITTTLGDTDGDGDYDELYAYGGRSFSIWDSQGNLVYDSGNDFELITADQIPTFFNSDDGLAEEFDERSDDKGPEPEALTIGTINDRVYAFIGLERTGGIMIYEVTDPTAPRYIDYVDYVTDAPGNVAPEGMAFIDGADSPTGTPLLVVANEVSNTVAIFDITPPVRISDIQGGTVAAGETVTDITGIVIEVTEGGFVIQDPVSDTNRDTAETIFIATPTAPTVAVGDEVLVNGQVGTGGTGVEIALDTVQVVSSGNALPATTPDPVDSVFLDLRDITGMVTTEFTVNREAAFDNFVGFYEVVNTDGGIDVDGDGLADLLPGDVGYADAALAGALDNVALATGDGQTSVVTTEIAGEALYAPILIVDATLDQAIAGETSNVLFAFGAANPDGQDQVLFQNGAIVFEDLTGLTSDYDFNDVVLNVAFA